LKHAEHVLGGSSGKVHLYIFKVKEERPRGRPRLTWIDNIIIEWARIDTCEKIKRTVEERIISRRKIMAVGFLKDDTYT